MASESSPPPPPGSGGKYALFGIVLLLLAGVGYWLTMSGPEPTSTTSAAGPPDAAVAQRATSLQDETLEIPEEEPDAWSDIPDAGELRRTPRGPILGTWDCPGEVDRAAASAVITEHRPQIQACYEHRLKQQALLQGSVQLQLRVGATGAVEATQVGGSLRDREVFSCIRNVASHMQFPRVTHGNCAVVSVPFSFTPQQ